MNALRQVEEPTQQTGSLDAQNGTPVQTPIILPDVASNVGDFSTLENSVSQDSFQDQSEVQSSDTETVDGNAPYETRDELTLMDEQFGNFGDMVDLPQNIVENPPLTQQELKKLIADYELANKKLADYELANKKFIDYERDNKKLRAKLTKNRNMLNEIAALHKGEEYCAAYNTTSSKKPRNH